MSDKNPYLSVVIPAYNEEKRIVATLESMISWLAARPYESAILVVDDGSSDKTREVASSLDNPSVPVRVTGYGENRGKGHAIRTGMLESTGEWVLFSDADMSTPIHMLERFESLMGKGDVDVVIGTRKTEGAYVGKRQAFYRENMGKVFTWLSNLILGIRVTDFTCGFKCFHRRAIEPVFGSQRIDGWSYDTEIVLIALHKGFRLREVPVDWFNDEATRVRLWKNVFTCLNELFQIWNNRRRGLYG